jgi:hypothetical protein
MIKLMGTDREIYMTELNKIYWFENEILPPLKYLAQKCKEKEYAFFAAVKFGLDRVATYASLTSNPQISYECL